MRRLWLVLWLVAVQARAQGNAPGEPSRSQGWQDPHLYELARLRLQRPSYFWPNALAIAGAGMLIGCGLVFAEDRVHDERAPIRLGVPAAAGALALTAGLLWRMHRTRQRTPYDRRIMELESARAPLPSGGPERTARDDVIRTLRQERPSIGPPIALTSAGLALVGIGSFSLLVGVATHRAPATVAGMGFISGGLAVVTGGSIWWWRTRARQRPYNDRIRALERLDVSLAPFVVRW